MSGSTNSLEIATFARFQDAYLTVLQHVSSRTEFVVAPRGNAARESLNVSFALADPRDRIVYLPQRRANIVFCYAEALWYLSGRDDLAMIGYYGPRLRVLSPDGETLRGTAYGPRLFAEPFDRRSQWQQVTEQLAVDPDSKRAVMTIFHPVELENFNNPDVSCTIAVQFLLRDGRLHAVTYMRGNDAVIGLLCDVFSFTLIQEFTAHQLGVALGTYSHHVASMHINHVDADRAAVIVAAAGQPHPRFPVPTMPLTRWRDLKIVQEHEEALRCNQHRLHPGDLDCLGLDRYWQQVLLLFEIYRQLTHQPPDTAIDPAALHALDPAYQWLVGHRWPHRLPDRFTPPHITTGPNP